MLNNKLSFTLPFLFCFCVISLVAQKPVDFIYSNLETALEKAKAENKNIFIETFTPHCAPCKILDKELRNPELASYLNEHFVNVKVNMNGAYAKDYQLNYSVVFLPTIIFLNTGGDVLWQLDRLATAQELMAICQKIVNPQVRRHRETAAAKTNATRPTTTPVVKSKKPDPANVAAPARKEPVSSTARPPITRPVSKPVTKKAIQQKTEKKKEEVVNNDINDDDGTILYVLGEGGTDLPPHVLRQEAYFRMQLMDGSHKETASQYLKTQEDWLSKINIRFLHDFLDDARSGEFNFLIANRDSFYSVLGEPLVDQTLNILVNKELERAFPRPDQKRATDLYGFIDHKDPTLAGNIYARHTDYETSNTEAFIEGVESIQALEQVEDHLLLYRYSSELIKSDTSKKKLKRAKLLAERAVELDPENEEYQENLEVYLNKL